MNARTLRALKGSIKKWENIITGVGVDLGPTNCALCRQFNVYDERQDTVDCTGCPVFDHTGQHGCHGTPYDEWSDHDFIRVRDDLPESLRIAKDELKFLKSLLPNSQ